MNKTELVRAISEKSGLTIKDSESALNAFIAASTEVLKKGEEISLVGFGSLYVTVRSARIGMNFKTKKSIEIPASRGVKFKAGKNLKDAIN